MGIIRILPPETARLIAAGEVIERPASVLRELLDNALDAGAREISVELSGGGIEALRVVDDGTGMDAEDLALAVLPHATSKIASADDLLRTRSLGFRGEALASIAAAARLEITSRPESAREARRLSAGPGIESRIEATQGRRGSSVEVRKLFENFPARRQFLKRSQAEAALCKQVLLDKALPHPGVGFRLVSEGKLSLLLPPTDRLEERVIAAFPEAKERELAREIHCLGFSGEGFSGKIVVALPSFYRSDRRLMEVFVNRRRVQDFTLISALDDGFSGFLPGGAHPFALLFAEVDPALADFNIHPAKREVRFKDPAALRRAIVQTLQTFLLGHARRGARLGELPGALPELGLGETTAAPLPENWSGWENPGLANRSAAWDAGWSSRPAASPSFGSSASPASWEQLSELRERLVPRPEPTLSPGNLRYLGQAFGLFLVVERGEELFLIDQHAAHERLLFDELSARPPAIQELLVPVVFEPESEAEETRLATLAERLTGLGFRLERESGGGWLLTALPSLLKADPEGTIRELLAGKGDDPERAARAMTACKAAIKDGELLDPASGAELARKALELPEPRCPHGRPVWVRLSREELFRLVRRIV